MDENKDNIHNKFKVELSELLKKYKAEIYLEDSSLNCAQTEYIVVEFNSDGHKIILGTFIN